MLEPFWLNQPEPILPDDNIKKKPKTDAMLYGDVKSGEEHKPFATIFIRGTTIVRAADTTGHFKVKILPVGKQTIVISAVGYIALEKEVELESKKSVTLLLELKPDIIGIEQAIVSTNRNEKAEKKHQR